MTFCVQGLPYLDVVLPFGVQKYFSRDSGRFQALPYFCRWDAYHYTPYQTYLSGRQFVKLSRTCPTKKGRCKILRHFENFGQWKYHLLFWSLSAEPDEEHENLRLTLGVKMSQNNPISIDDVPDEEWFAMNVPPSYPPRVQAAIDRAKSLRRAQRDALTALHNARNAVPAAELAFNEADDARINAETAACHLVLAWEEAIEKAAAAFQ